MKYDFEKIVPRENTSSYKYDMRSEVFGRADVLPMWVADHDLAVPPAVTDALRRRIEMPAYGYEFRGEAFNNAVIDWIRVRNGWQIKPEWIIFSPGVVTSLVLSLLGLSREGDGIVIQPPVYPPFARCVEENGRRVIKNPLIVRDGRYEIDFDDLDLKLADARALMLCNPQNPTGRVFTREELLRMGNLCVKHDVYIISDEIHSDLMIAPSRHIHIASLSPEIAQRTVTLVAPSKTFNLAGLAASVAIIPDPETRKLFSDALNRAHVGMGNTFGNAALIAAYDNGGEWLDQFLVHIAGNIKYARQFIAEKMPKIRTYDTQGTYLMWLDMSDLGLEGDSLRDFVVNEARLGLNDGREFGSEGAGHMRINIAAPRRTVEQALRQLHEAYERL